MAPPLPPMYATVSFPADTLTTQSPHPTHSCVSQQPRWKPYTQVVCSQIPGAYVFAGLTLIRDIFLNLNCVSFLLTSQSRFGVQAFVIFTCIFTCKPPSTRGYRRAAGTVRGPEWITIPGSDRARRKCMLHHWPGKIPKWGPATGQVMEQCLTVERYCYRRQLDELLVGELRGVGIHET